MLERNKIESLILILSLILLAGLVYNFGNIVMILIPALQQELGMTIVKFLSMTLGFIVIPTWIVKKINLDIK
ncbi:CPBP family intramembrane metalloprotease, partial [Streptococcus mutans]|nr:CPBP family intramembrane metalloprotease [Streptococcus mutans]